MQENATSIPDWLLPYLRNLASFGAGALILRLITIWQNRKKPAIEIEKLEDEATEIRIRSRAVAGDSWMRMMDRLEKTATINENLRTKNSDLQEKCDKLEIQAESYERQINRMSATLKLHGLNYDNTQDKPLKLLTNDEE